MQRCAAVVLAGMALVVGGCQDKEKNDPMATQAVDYGMTPDYYASSPSSTSTTAAYPVESSGYDAGGYGDGAYDDIPVSGTGSRHTVAKGDTLFKLARQYYRDQSRWKDIYEANRNVLSDPHKLSVGQELTIP